jgi:hypothetical protein
VSVYQGANLVEGNLGAMDKDFILLASYTPFHILSDPMVHSWPREAVFGLPDRLVSPWVPCCGVVMYQGHEVSLLGLRDSIDGDRSYEFLRWEYGYILVVLLPLVDVQRSREDVQPCVGLAGYVMDNEVILLQVCMPLGCSSVEVLRCFPVLEVHVVYKDNEGKLGPFQVVSPVG